MHQNWLYSGARKKNYSQKKMAVLILNLICIYIFTQKCKNSYVKSLLILQYGNCSSSSPLGVSSLSGWKAAMLGFQVPVIT